jgi:hypothetical protein
LVTVFLALIFAVLADINGSHPDSRQGRPPAPDDTRAACADGGTRSANAVISQFRSIRELPALLLVVPWPCRPAG